jgi:hypothetical protein
MENNTSIVEQKNIEEKPFPYRPDFKMRRRRIAPEGWALDIVVAQLGSVITDIYSKQITSWYFSQPFVSYQMKDAKYIDWIVSMQNFDRNIPLAAGLFCLSIRPLCNMVRDIREFHWTDTKTQTRVISGFIPQDGYTGAED